MRTGLGLVDYEEAAIMLGLNPYTLRRYVCARKLPFLKIGKRVFFDPDDLRQWVEAHRVPPNGEIAK
jgi:excisionase family DNA binding protein